MLPVPYTMVYGMVKLILEVRWRSPENVYRKNWNVNGVPTLARYQQVNGEVVETARLVENGIVDEAKLREFIG